MTKTYAQLKKQIETLTREADGLRQKERQGVITRIREAIEIYELTAADLGLAGAGRGKGKGKGAVADAPARRKPGRKPGAKKASKSKDPSAIRFRDAEGNTWVGRGPRPTWLRTALAEGKQLQDFAV